MAEKRFLHDKLLSSRMIGDPPSGNPFYDFLRYLARTATTTSVSTKTFSVLSLCAFFTLSFAVYPHQFSSCGRLTRPWRIQSPGGQQLPPSPHTGGPAGRFPLCCPPGLPCRVVSPTHHISPLRCVPSASAT